MTYVIGTILTLFFIYAFQGVFSFFPYLFGLLFKFFYWPMELFSKVIYPVGSYVYVLYAGTVIAILFLLIFRLFKNH